jgi:fructokinase
MGHIFPRRAAGDEAFPGVCPFHGDCLEGLASGPAIIARWGASLDRPGAGDEAPAIVADYLAQLCHALFAITAVETVVLGGGVMQASGLLDRVRERTDALGNGYLPGRLRQSIVAPRLGALSAIKGCLALAHRALTASTR